MCMAAHAYLSNQCVGCFVCRKKKNKKEKKKKHEREAAADVESDDSDLASRSVRPSKRKTPAEIAFENSKRKKVKSVVVL